MSELCPNGSVLGSGSSVEDTAELWLRLGDEWQHCCVSQMFFFSDLCSTLTSVCVLFAVGEIQALSLLDV